MSTARDFICVSFVISWVVVVVLCDTSTLKPPLTDVKVGANGRTEYMKAVISKDDLRTGTAATNAARKFVADMGVTGDHAGHIVANLLGGVGDPPNIFPQNPKVNLRKPWKTDVERATSLYIESETGKTVVYEVWLLYDTPEATRPYGLWHRIVDAESNDEVIPSGFIANPDQTAPEGTPEPVGPAKPPTRRAGSA